MDRTTLDSPVSIVVSARFQWGHDFSAMDR